MTRSIEELTRIQHLWADAGRHDADVLCDALEHIAAHVRALRQASKYLSEDQNEKVFAAKLGVDPYDH